MNKRINCLKFFVMLVFAVCLSVIPKLSVNAEDGYIVSVDAEGGIVCHDEGELITNTRLALKTSGNTYIVVKPGTSGSSIYYFDKNGKGKKLTSTRFMNIEYAGKTKVYYAKNGIIQKNKIVGSTKEGYYYADKNGVRVRNNEYVITKNEKNKLVCYYKGKQKKNIRIAVKVTGNTYKSVNPKTTGSKIYSFNKYGSGKWDKGTRYVKIAYKGTQKNYYIKRGVVQKNKIVGAKGDYKYAGPDGVCVNDKATREAVKFVINHTSSSDSRETKLKKCYLYMVSNFKYKRVYDVNGLYPNENDIDDITYEIFSTGYGNCHRFASAFAYIAKVLGYTSRVDVGWSHGAANLPGASGGLTPHGWAEVYIDGQWYYFDPDLDLYTGNHLSYYKSGEFYYKVKWKLQSNVKNGTLKWKTVE